MEKAKMALGDLPTVRHERYPLHHELVIKLSVTVLKSTWSRRWWSSGVLEQADEMKN